jgi:hypothetical protein
MVSLRWSAGRIDTASPQVPLKGSSPAVSIGRAGTAVAMMPQMQNAAIFRDLHVERQVRFKAMLPIQSEAQEIEIEFLRLRFVEDAEFSCIEHCTMSSNRS